MEAYAVVIEALRREAADIEAAIRVLEKLQAKDTQGEARGEAPKTPQRRKRNAAAKPEKPEKKEPGRMGRKAWAVPSTLREIAKELRGELIDGGMGTENDDLFKRDFELTAESGQWIASRVAVLLNIPPHRVYAAMKRITK